MRKYRSIDREANFELGDFTVLIGPNNQGKSNLLRATVLAMETIEGYAALNHDTKAGNEVPITSILRHPHRNPWSSRYGRDMGAIGYDWEKDFPLFARNRNGTQQSTVVQIDYELNPDEQSEFYNETGITINEKLPVRISLKKGMVTISIPKQGRGQHREKAREIARFITDRIALLHIPAVRTGSAALKIAEEILTSRRRQLLRSTKYAAALKALEEIDATVRSEVEDLLRQSLTRFIPDASSVQLETRPPYRTPTFNGISTIHIDDGVLTSIDAKGDGIQSLVALALAMEWTTSVSHPDKQLIFAVEEPESHLHPGAVRELRTVLQTLSASQQVIVTTHSQALVNHRDLRRNIIVSGRSAKSANSLEDIRNTLGVQLSDALASSEVTVVCEGNSDELLLPNILKNYEPRIEKWMADGLLVFESAHGGSKIYSRVLAAQSILTRPIVVIDSDEAGNKDVERLLKEKVIEPTSVVKIHSPPGSTQNLRI
ncbi:AAA family ATPase [Actinomyces bowdenii]|uniref:ATP-binding protein n=1 Tax=Actinomyces bowdenii TaxID=131109 RepID=A0A853EJ34_9ACTO|nr:AAA family ATPase [Actinomyces bowdenii]MBF0696049.1 ATP-binding protein [Actinomyces bowdenii]NYS68222.1 ATP-binding protein [Actinomyces bowdenii]